MVRHIGHPVFSGLSRADIGGDRDHRNDILFRVAKWRFGRFEYSAGAIRSHDFFFKTRHWLAGVENLPVAIEVGLGAVPQQCGDGAADIVGRHAACVLGLACIDEYTASRLIGGHDEGWDCIDYLGQHLAIISGGLFARALTFLKFMRKQVGAAFQKLLLCTQMQKVAGTARELGTIQGGKKEIGSTGFEGPHPDLAVMVSGEHNDRNVVALGYGTESTNELGAAHARHFIIRNDQVRRALRAIDQRRGRILKCYNFKVGLDGKRKLRQEEAIGSLVIKDENEGHVVRLQP